MMMNLSCSLSFAEKYFSSSLARDVRAQQREARRRQQRQKGRRSAMIGRAGRPGREAQALHSNQGDDGGNDDDDDDDNNYDGDKDDDNDDGYFQRPLTRLSSSIVRLLRTLSSIPAGKLSSISP